MMYSLTKNEGDNWQADKFYDIHLATRTTDSFYSCIFGPKIAQKSFFCVERLRFLRLWRPLWTKPELLLVIC